MIKFNIYRYMEQHPCRSKNLVAILSFNEWSRLVKADFAKSSFYRSSFVSISFPSASTGVEWLWLQSQPTKCILYLLILLSDSSKKTLRLPLETSMRLCEPALPRDVAALFSLAPAPTMEQRDLAPTMAAMSLSLASSIFPLSLSTRLRWQRASIWPGRHPLGNA